MGEKEGERKSKRKSAPTIPQIVTAHDKLDVTTSCLEIYLYRYKHTQAIAITKKKKRYTV